MTTLKIIANFYFKQYQLPNWLPHIISYCSTLVVSQRLIRMIPFKFFVKQQERD